MEDSFSTKTKKNFEAIYALVKGHPAHYIIILVNLEEYIRRVYYDIWDIRLFT